MRPPLVRETSRLTWGRGAQEPKGQGSATVAVGLGGSRARTRPRWPQELDLLEEAGRLPGKDRFGGTITCFLSHKHVSVVQDELTERLQWTTNSLVNAKKNGTPYRHRPALGLALQHFSESPTVPVSGTSSCTGLREQARRSSPGPSPDSPARSPSRGASQPDPAFGSVPTEAWTMRSCPAETSGRLERMPCASLIRS